VAFWILNIDHRFIVYSFEYFLGDQMFPIDIMPNTSAGGNKVVAVYYVLFAHRHFLGGSRRGTRTHSRFKPAGFC
jgi:hypothetical protein